MPIFEEKAKIQFKSGNILIPKNIDMTKWSVVACDQFTSEPEYWNEVKAIVGESPSTLNLMLPEIYLKEENINERINNIKNNMDKLIDSSFFKEYKDSMIYLERTQSDGKVREGLMGVVDLEDYSFEKDSQTLIRATENIIIEKILPRLKIRKNAALELSHILILIDDDKRTIIESLKNNVTKDDIVYDFDLIKTDGHIKGYLLNNNLIEEVTKKLEILADPIKFEYKYNVKNKGVLLFAIGDGNHSLASAKTYYENLKKVLSKEEYLIHPARYALVELVNLYSDALEFEAINRVVFNVNPEDLINELKKYYVMNQEKNGQEVEIVTKENDEKWYIENPKHNIAVGSIQIFLEDYLNMHLGYIDYIHGDEITKKLAKNNNVGFIFKPIAKEELFKRVLLYGCFPTKTFSIGQCYDKRYYLESRMIK